MDRQLSREVSQTQLTGTMREEKGKKERDGRMRGSEGEEKRKRGEGEREAICQANDLQYKCVLWETEKGCQPFPCHFLMTHHNQQQQAFHCLQSSQTG